MADRDLFRGAPLVSRVWRVLPTFVRLGFYQSIWWIYDKLWPRSRVSRVHRLLPGLYLKYGLLKSSEAHAMALIRRHTNLTSSVVLDYIPHIVIRHDTGPPTRRGGFLLMTAVRGTTLESVEHTLTSNQIATISMALRDYLRTLNRIPNPYEHGMCSAAGDAIESIPFTADTHLIPIFRGTREFHAWVRERSRANWTYLEPMMTPIFTKYDDGATVFSHGDLSPDNIMIRNGEFVGLIDWETGGWMPPYWDWFAARWEHSPTCRTIVKSALEGEYDTVSERYRVTLAGALCRGLTQEECAMLDTD